MKKSPTREQLDLLVVRVGRHQVRQVAHHAPQRRLPAHHLVALPPVACAGDEGGDGCDERRRGDEPVQVDQQRQQRDERQDLADQHESRLDHLHRTVGGLPLDRLDQVVELRPFEENQIELVRLAHDQQLNAVGDLFLEQLLTDIATRSTATLLNAPMANCSATRNATCGSAAVPAPVVTAETTASTSSFESQTRTAGNRALQQVEDGQSEGQARVGVPHQRKHASEAMPRGSRALPHDARVKPAPPPPAAKAGVVVPFVDVASVRPTRAAASRRARRA